MTTEGPSIDELTHRLSDTPTAFLAEPRIGDRGEVYVGAVVGDVLLDHGHVPSDDELKPFQARDTERRNWLRLVLVSAWLAHYEWFRENGDFGGRVHSFLAAELDALSGLVVADLFTTDPDRREELARLLLQHLGLRPRGESEDQAADRLETVDSVQRADVLREMAAKRRRAEELRKEMERKKAREAAAKYNRE